MKQLLPAVLLAAALLTACGSESAKDSVTQAAQDSAAVTEAVTDDERAPYAELAPEVQDFGGYNFRIFVNGEFNEGSSPQYFAYEENGETVNDAVFRRNTAVAERYNITITPVTGFSHSDDYSLALQNIQAGDDFADVTGLFLIQSSIKLAQAGALLDWNDYDAINLSAPWWDSRVKDLEVYGKQYVLTGDIATADDMRQMVVTYNKALWNEMDYEDAYTIVKEGRWTLDLMYSLAKDVSKDLNGDGKMTVADQWGILSETKAAWYLFLGSGQKSIIYDGTSYISNLSDADNYDVMNGVIEIMSDTDNVCVINDGTHDGELTTDGVWDEASKIFADGRTLLHTETFNGTEKLRNMGQDYGVLPIPKWSEAQEEYYCMTNDDICMLSLPTTVSDPERAALIIEAMAYESMFVLQPTFYEVYLSEKLLRDEQSREMMDLVLDSKFFDMDFCFGAITGMSEAMESMASSKQNKISSRIASLEKSAQKKIDKLLDAITEN